MFGKVAGGLARTATGIEDKSMWGKAQHVDKQGELLHVCSSVLVEHAAVNALAIAGKNGAALATEIARFLGRG